MVRGSKAGLINGKAGGVPARLREAAGKLICNKRDHRRLVIMRFDLVIIRRGLSSTMKRWLPGLVLVASVGCASNVGRTAALMTKDGSATYSGSFSMPSAPGPPLKLMPEDLDSYLEIERTRGPLTVKGAREYQGLAESLARLGGETLEQTKRELGIQSNLEIHIVLVPVDRDAWPSTFEFETKVLNCHLTSPLLVDSGNDNLVDFLRFNGPEGIDFFTSGVIGHEYFEAGLVIKEGNLRVAMDLEAKWYGIPLIERNFTRWYRDGFATYAAMVWLDKLYDRAGIPAEERPEMAFLKNAEDSFKRIGAGIFRWTQFRRNENQPRYEASLGLFLKLEEEFGRDRIREWNEAIAASTDEFKGRADLLQAAKDVFGIDLQVFARRAGN